PLDSAESNQGDGWQSWCGSQAFPKCSRLLPGPQKSPRPWGPEAKDVPRGDRVERIAYPNLPAVEAIRKAA
ncbi:MAG: hypothetical protein ACK55I_03260, partial [bacterium]